MWTSKEEGRSIQDKVSRPRRWSME